MSRWSERDIARKLAERDELEPPAGLLEKIKGEIPPMIPVGTGVPEPEKKNVLPPRQRWLIAASLVAMVGAGLFALRLRTDMAPVPEPARAILGARGEEKGMVAPGTATPGAAPAEPLALRSEMQVNRLKEAPPSPKPLSEKEEKALRALGYVGSAKESAGGDVKGGAPGGVVGGAPAPASPPPVAAPLAAAQAPEKAKKDAPVQPLLDERRAESTDRINVGGNESGQQGMYAGPGGSAPARDASALQEVEAPQAAVAKAARTDSAWETPSSRFIALTPIPGTASYAAARLSLLAGRLPDPATVRTGEILNAFETEETPRVEGAPTPFVHGPRYRLLRVHPTGARQARIRFDPAAVARYRVVGTGLSALYEIELRSEASQASQVATLRLGEIERAVPLYELAPSWDKASPGFRLAALAAELAEVLKGGPGNPAEIARQAREVDKDLPESAKATELAEMAERVGEARGRR